MLITSLCDSVSVSEGLAQKAGLIRRLKPILRGGAGSHPTPNHMIGKQMVNTTLAKGHHTPPSARLKISHFFHTLAVRPFIIHY